MQSKLSRCSTKTLATPMASTRCRLRTRVPAIPASRRHDRQQRKGQVCAAAAVVEAESWATSTGPTKAPTKAPTSFQFVCPICNQTEFNLLSLPDKPQPLTCPRCARSFNGDSEFIDLTLTSGITQKVYQQQQWRGTETFRSPIVSFVYERGWRQNFAFSGFPGPDKEFEMAMEYLKPAYGEVMVDMSCGSGLFTRRFAKSGKFSGVVAADFSESMLRQSKEFLKEEGILNGPGTPVVLLRADVGRLPFATGSLAAIHAGAALHCWPNPQAALAEISRVLCPGGVFVASTFLVATAPLGQLLGKDDIVRPLNQISLMNRAAAASGYRWWDESEIQELCVTVGLQNYGRTRDNRFILFCAQKPLASPSQ